MRILTLLLQLFFLWIIFGGGEKVIKNTPFMRKHDFLAKIFMFFLLRRAGKVLAK